MSGVLIDTNILIDYSKGYTDQMDELLNQHQKGLIQLFTNPIIIAEYFVDKNLEDLKEMKKAQKFFRFFQVVDLNKQIGETAGEYLRKKLISNLGDSFIAATCTHHNLSLVTRNVKDFKKVPHLHFYPLP